MTHVRLSYGSCVIYCNGMEINCPLCGRLVKSGQRHECKKRALNSAIDTVPDVKVKKEKA
jgi:hypothetical protein